MHELMKMEQLWIVFIWYLWTVGKLKIALTHQNQ